MENSTCRLDYETTFSRIRFVCCSGWLYCFYPTDSALVYIVYQKTGEFPEVQAIVPLSFSDTMILFENFKAEENEFSRPLKRSLLSSRSRRCQLMMQAFDYNAKASLESFCQQNTKTFNLYHCSSRANFLDFNLKAREIQTIRTLVDTSAVL